MQIEELRIGNYVNRVEVSELDIITGITEDGVHFRDGDIKPIIAINPIPLTEKWLLKFGLKKTKPESSGYFGYSNDVIEIENKIQLVLYDGHINEDTTKIFMPNIEYVHQLQNLYFALTGDELEVKT